MVSNTAVEQYLALAKNAQNKALENIIERVLGDPKLFVFGEFLSLQ